MLSMLGQGFGVTLQIFFLTLVGSLPLGVVVALARMSRVKPIAWIMKFYISVMRGTPLMRRCSSFTSLPIISSEFL